MMSSDVPTNECRVDCLTLQTCFNASFDSPHTRILNMFNLVKTVTGTRPTRLRGAVGIEK